MRVRVGEETGTACSVHLPCVEGESESESGRGDMKTVCKSQRMCTHVIGGLLCPLVQQLCLSAAAAELVGEA